VAIAHHQSPAPLVVPTIGAAHSLRIPDAAAARELEIGARVGPECGVAPAEDDRPDEQLQLVDESRRERLWREGRAIDQELPAREVAFEPSVRRGRRGQGRGVDDLVRRLPSARVVGHGSDCAARAGSVSHTASVSYMRRP
jgi:hypothetical protein